MRPLIDVHTHVHFPAYDHDREQVIKRAQAAGIKMICVGTQFFTSESAIKLAEQYPNDIWATAGFHPSHFNDDWYYDKKEQREAIPEKFEIEKLRNLAKHPKIVAIGECGLDYYRLGENREAQTKKQQEAFLKLAALAQELEKPLMIHCRPSKGTDDAYEDLLGILKSGQGYTPNAVLHFYVGSLEMTKKFVEAGFYFTFGGVVTFARNFDEVITYIPLDRIMLETDAPYVSPAPYRGKRNEPSYIVETAKKMAELKKISYEEVAEKTLLTTTDVFGKNWLAS